MVKIGDILYRFNENRRVYGPDRRMIYAKHFEAENVIGETSKSWIVGHPQREHLQSRVSKKNLTARNGNYGRFKFYTEEGRSDAIWRDRYRHRIVRMVEQANTTDLKKIARLLGGVE